MIPLNLQNLSDELLNHGFDHPYAIHVFQSIDSTNRYLKDLPMKESVIDICCSEMQTAGRGRFGRHWHSPYGENIYCSTRWNLNCDVSKLSGLSLITSLAVLATIQAYCPDPNIKIKWPNDILWNDKKLCGSLIEIISGTNRCAQIIIGIGLNVNSQTHHQPVLDNPWCSLHDISQQYFNRNTLIALLISNLARYLCEFITDDFNTFMDEWRQHDYLLGQCITVNQTTTSMTGIARGIDAEGLLILEDTDGTLHHLAAGDTSLRSRNE